MSHSSTLGRRQTCALLVRHGPPISASCRAGASRAAQGGQGSNERLHDGERTIPTEIRDATQRGLRTQPGGRGGRGQEGGKVGGKVGRWEGGKTSLACVRAPFSGTFLPTCPGGRWAAASSLCRPPPPSPPPSLSLSLTLFRGAASQRSEGTARPCQRRTQILLISASDEGGERAPARKGAPPGGRLAVRWAPRRRPLGRCSPT